MCCPLFCLMESLIKKCADGQRYVDLLTDSGFKAVFGDKENKQVLIDFLNAVLPNGRQVKDLTYSTTEIPGFTTSNKSIRLDLRCQDVDGSSYIVEMQKYNQRNFFKRCVLYSSRVYGLDLTKGDIDYDIQPVYMVAIIAEDDLNRDPEVWKDRFVSEYTFREKVTGDTLDNTIFCTFVELKRFDKELKSCRDIVEKWCYALKYMSRLDRLPGELGIEVFKRLFVASEIAQFDEDKRIKYEEDMMSERDYKSIINTAKVMGLEQGLEQGRAEGHAAGVVEGRMEMARKLKSLGVSIDVIVQASGLTAEQVMYL